MDIYPAIDLLDGRCVRLWKGQFDKTTFFDERPSDIARRYAAAGAHVLHLIDLDGARAGVPVNLDTLRLIAGDSSEISIQWGGGLRTAASVESALVAGAARVIVGSAAVSDPGLVGSWVRTFGTERIVVALDVRPSVSADGETRYMPAVSGWAEASTRALWSLVDELTALGVTHFLSTDIEKDGTKTGPNFDLYQQFVDRYPSLRVQASGGVSSAADLGALEVVGVDAVVVGRTLLDGTLNAEALFC